METTVDQSEYVDWKGRTVQPGKHGGKRGATFVCDDVIDYVRRFSPLRHICCDIRLKWQDSWSFLRFAKSKLRCTFITGQPRLGDVVEVLQNMVFISNASNLVTYFYSYMHYSIPQSANMVTNYMGTAFLLTLPGGFIADSFITRFWAIILFAVAQLFGLIILTIQARETSLRPGLGQSPSTSQAAMLFVGLYAMAVGVGGVKANLPAHGADQFDRSDKHLVSSFFNWFFFCLCTGGMLAVTILVWIQENKGWEWGLGVCTVSLSIAILIFVTGFRHYKLKVPSGSPLTRILQVFVFTARNWKVSVQTTDFEEPRGRYHTKFRFLEKATFGGHVSPQQVEETKSFLSLLPIFASTIMMNCCLAQLQTFSVQQGKTMDTKLSHDFRIPPASLTAIPLVVMLISVPLYDRLTSSMRKKANGTNFLVKPLQRIGIGLVLASGSMIVAALVEIKRRRAAIDGGNLTVFWLGWQFLLLGVSDMFTLAGMLEFFYSEAPDTMRSMCTSLSWCSTSMGYFLSSVIVMIVNSASGHFGSKEWLGGRSLNENRLDLFYALLAVLNFINFLNYVFWARWY